MKNKLLGGQFHMYPLVTKQLQYFNWHNYVLQEAEISEVQDINGRIFLAENMILGLMALNHLDT